MNEHSHQTSPFAARVAELEDRLVQRGVLTAQQVEETLETFSQQLGAHNGARYVARAWVDPGFREQLLSDAMVVLRQYGTDLRGASNRESPFLRLIAVANTATVHNVVVCTLCSCYPVALLGPPPGWYKSYEYRARIVREPRTVLREFGVDLAHDVEVRVWDSTADCRYLVIPQRPPGTEQWTEEQLRAVVTRNSLIGTAVVGPPNPSTAS